MTRTRTSRALLACAAICLVSLPALAASDEELAKEDRIAALERKVEVLTSELERTRSEMALPEEKDLESSFGLGPGASKVYSLSQGLSIGGYAEGYYSGIVGDKRESGAQSRTDFLRAVLYAGYKFTDNFVYNMEIEFEHGSTEDGGAVSVEFAALDYLYKDWANARAGLLLMPMGFVNEMHEPPFYYGVHRPEVERRIIPSTWRENGVGLFGTIAEQLDYKLYLVNGFDATGFEPSGVREGRQDGSEALAEHLAFVGRLDWTPVPDLLVGGSVYVGSSGQDQSISVSDGGTFLGEVHVPDALTTIWELHGQFERGGLHTRALFSMIHIDDAADLSRALGPVPPAFGQPGGIGQLAPGEAIASRMLGLYAEVGYEVLQWIIPETNMSLEPFFRYEYLDTQNDVPTGFVRDRSQIESVYTAGLHFKPIPNVVVKLDYRNRSARSGQIGDEVNAGIGLVF
jgi:hypothetical protein